MRRFGKILVGVEFSQTDDPKSRELTSCSRAAFNCALWLAEANEAELTIFTAVDIPAPLEGYFGDRMGQVSREIDKDIDRVLEALVAEAAERKISAHPRRAFGKPSVEIIKEVESEGIQLVVIGTRDLSRAGRILFGSTGLKLLHRCPCAVWVTKPGTVCEDLKVLVANDLSDLGLDAMQIAVNLGQVADTKTRVLHAVEHDLDARFWGLYLSETDISAYRRTLFKNAERALNEQLLQTDYRTLRYGVQLHVVDGPPDQAILKAVKEYEIDLLVMGTIARSGVSRMLIGNTAERLLSQVGCSVLAIKPGGLSRMGAAPTK
ncbi:MAG: universal stress protein [Planctomycetaceae bacterium]